MTARRGISVKTLRNRLVFLGGNDAQARRCCVRECGRELPRRTGGRSLEIAKLDGHWRYVGSLCHECAVAVRAYQYYDVDGALNERRVEL